MSAGPVSASPLCPGLQVDAPWGEGADEAVLEEILRKVCALPSTAQLRVTEDFSLLLWYGKRASEKPLQKSLMAYQLPRVVSDS